MPETKKPRRVRRIPFVRLTLVCAALGAAMTVLAAWTIACISPDGTPAGRYVVANDAHLWWMARLDSLGWEGRNWMVQYRWLPDSTPAQREALADLKKQEEDLFGRWRALPESEPRYFLEAMSERAKEHAVEHPEMDMAGEVSEGVAVRVSEFSFGTHSFGLPFKAMWFGQVERFRYETEQVGSFELGWFSPEYPRDFRNEKPARLPYFIHPAGFIANTAIFGSVWAVLLFGAALAVGAKSPTTGVGN